MADTKHYADPESLAIALVIANPDSPYCDCHELPDGVPCQGCLREAKRTIKGLAETGWRLARIDREGSNVSAETVAPFYRNDDWFVCGWCGSNMGEKWVGPHRESHRNRLEQLAQLARREPDMTEQAESVAAIRERDADFGEQIPRHWQAQWDRRILLRMLDATDGAVPTNPEVISSKLVGGPDA